jgi:hypothetical protein
MLRTCWKIVLLSIIASICGRAGAESRYDEWDEDYMVQALLGAVQFESLRFDDNGGTTPVEVDLSLMPQFGGAWMTMPQPNRRFQYGLECSFLLGFVVDKVNYATAGSGGLRVSISTSLWMFDLAGGPYASFNLTDSLRIYGGAGPLITYADYEADRTETSSGTEVDYTNSESIFGVGVYGRGGVELQVHERGYLGVGVRGTWSKADFSEVGGSSEIDSVALFVTYTAGLY